MVGNIWDGQQEYKKLTVKQQKDNSYAANNRLTGTDDICVRIIEPPSNAVIPIIFLPGIMGTNLKSTENDDVVWRPPNMDGVGPVINAVGQLIKFLFTGAATRKKMLDPSRVKIDLSGSINTEGCIDEDVAREHGWGALARSSYHPVMSLMANRLNHIMESKAFKSGWDTEGKRAPKDYGDEKDNQALTDDELAHASNYQFEVWAGGYNWLQSNAQSGQDIVNYINEVVLEHYKQKKMRVGKAILVTHSMGGLVARAAWNIDEGNSILGVVHGVMPATGAPATYHHVRCGYTGVSSVILGRNAAEVTAIVGNSEGALELLPTGDYKGGKPWLKLGGSSHEGAQLPIADPYEEIYKSSAWYGLVPKHNEALLTPEIEPLRNTAVQTGFIGQVAMAKQSNSPSPLRTSSNSQAIKDFHDRIDRVKQFHLSIQGKYPSPAYVSFSDSVELGSYDTVHWQGDEIADLHSVTVQNDNKNGKLHLQQGGEALRLKIGEPLQPGDGTVSTISGEAPSDTKVEASFRHGSQGKGQYAKHNKKGKPEGYVHQDSYLDPRSQWATLYSIIKIAQNANWHTQ